MTELRAISLSVFAKKHPSNYSPRLALLCPQKQCLSGKLTSHRRTQGRLITTRQYNLKGVTHYTLHSKAREKEYEQNCSYSFCFSAGITPACHLERSPPEIPPSLCSVPLRSSTSLRYAQNDTGGRSRNPKGERQCRSDLAGRLKPALWKVPLAVAFFRGAESFCSCFCLFYTSNLTFPLFYCIN